MSQVEYYPGLHQTLCVANTWIPHVNTSLAKKNTTTRNTKKDIDTNKRREQQSRVDPLVGNKGVLQKLY